jgi:hypothetical protein
MAMATDEALDLARQQLMVLQQAAAVADCLKDVRLGDRATSLYDLNGAEALLRVSLLDNDLSEIGYADIAAVPEFGVGLFAVNRGMVWDEKRIRAETVGAGLNGDGDFIAHEYPRVGIEVSVGSEDRRVRDWLSGEIEPLEGTASEFRKGQYSLLDGLSPSLKEENRERYDALRHTLAPPAALLADLKTVEIKYSKCSQSHRCFELRTQVISPWCAPTSVEMLLAFYRYEYSQRDIAYALGQETILYGAIDLGVGSEYLISEAISTLTRGALHARMYSRGFWPIIVEEVTANRPLILFSGGHARVVTGYSVLNIDGTLCNGLILYDPLGFETCWEAFNPSSDLLLFSAALRHWVPPEGPTVRSCAAG